MEEQGEADTARGSREVQECRRRPQRYALLLPVHPHGGGEGRAPIGRTRPLTPWGKPALGIKTRKNKKLSNNLILRRRS